MPPEEAPSRWDERRELLMVVLAVVSIGIGVWSYVTPPNAVGTPVIVLDVGIALAFLTDWVYRVARAPRRLRYAVSHAYEAVAFVPYTLVPALEGGGVLRSVRFLRFVRFLRHARALRLTLAFARLPSRTRYLRRVVDRAQIAKIVLSGFVIQVVGSLGLYLAEAEANPDLGGLQGAWWWAFQSFTTVAYAVPNPTTLGGFFLAGALNVVGLAYFAIFTASLANALFKEPGPDDEDGG